MPSSGCCVSDVKMKADIYFLWKINSWKLWINAIRNRSRHPAIMGSDEERSLQCCLQEPFHGDGF